MSSDFYEGLRDMLRWLDRPGVIMNNEVLERLERLRSSLTPPSFDHIPGREYLDVLVTELSTPAVIPIDKATVLELLQLVHDLPRLAIEAATTPEEAVMSSSGTLAPTIMPLTAVDRCDRCSAAAQIRAVVMTDEGAMDLLFCGHHARKHHQKLRELSANLYNSDGQPQAA